MAGKYEKKAVARLKLQLETAFPGVQVYERTYPASLAAVFENASKSKTRNKGYPDLVARLGRSTLVVCECKWGAKKHMLRGDLPLNVENARDYACGGVVHYMSHAHAKSPLLNIIGIAYTLDEAGPGPGGGFLGGSSDDEYGGEYGSGEYGSGEYGSGEYSSDRDSDSDSDSDDGPPARRANPAEQVSIYSLHAGRRDPLRHHPKATRVADALRAAADLRDPKTLFWDPATAWAVLAKPPRSTFYTTNHQLLRVRFDEKRHFQRPIDSAHVDTLYASIKAEKDDVLTDTIYVAKYCNGYYLQGGQHRYRALERLSREGVTKYVHVQLTAYKSAEFVRVVADYERLNMAMVITKSDVEIFTAEKAHVVEKLKAIGRWWNGEVTLAEFLGTIKKVDAFLYGETARWRAERAPAIAAAFVARLRAAFAGAAALLYEPPGGLSAIVNRPRANAHELRGKIREYLGAQDSHYISLSDAAVLDELVTLAVRQNALYKRKSLARMKLLYKVTPLMHAKATTAGFLLTLNAKSGWVDELKPLAKKK